MNLEIKLSRNSWHYKLQGYVLKRNRPNLFSFCPYFWLTIFCVLVVPFVFLKRTLYKGCDLLNDHVFEPFQDKVIVPFQERVIDRWLDKLEAADVGAVYYHEKKMPSTKLNRWDVIRKWMIKKGVWKPEDGEDAFYEKLSVYQDEYYKRQEECAKKKRELYTKQYKREEARREQVREMKFKLMTVITWTKRVLFILLSLVGFWLIYQLVRGIIYLCQTVKLAAVISILKTLGIAIMFVGAVFVVGFIVVKFLVPWMKTWSNSRCDSGKSWFSMGCEWIGNRIMSVFKWLGNGIDILITYFKATKENYCPGIVWEEEKK